MRDVTLGEDASRVRKGAAPAVLAACRNLLLNLLRQRGEDNIAAALRRLAGRPHEAVAIVLVPSPLMK